MPKSNPFFQPTNARISAVNISHLHLRTLSVVSMLLTAASAVVAAPSITSLSPASGGAGTAATISGGSFGSSQGSSTVKFNGTSAGTAASWGDTSITVSVPNGATTGNVVVTVAGVASNGMNFTVIPAPTLTSVSPASGVQGTSVAVTLTGSNFVAGATVAVSNPGITVGSVTVVSATQITATFTIAANAATGAANITVTTSGGTSGTVVFTVNPPAPVLTSVSPASGVQGTSVPVTLAGSNFVAGATVSATNSGVTVGGVTVVSAAQITATLTIAANAALGAAKVTVTTSGGTSGTAAFTVNPPAPVLTSVSPASAGQGAKPWLTLTGTNFAAGAIVAVSGTGTSVSAVIVTSATQITALFTIDPSAVPGARNVTVTTSAGTSNALPFTVIAVPSIGSVSPTTATGGTQVTIGGSYFGATRGTGSVWLGTAPATVVSWADTQIVATVASNAQSGNALVQQNGLASNSVPFTVITPNILTVTPTIGAPGDTVTIAGSHFGAAQG